MIRNSLQNLTAHRAVYTDSTSADADFAAALIAITTALITVGVTCLGPINTRIMCPHRPQRTKPVNRARPPRADLRLVRLCMWAFSTIMTWLCSNSSN